MSLYENGVGAREEELVWGVFKEEMVNLGVCEFY